MNAADRVRYHAITGDKEAHVMACDTTESRVIPAHLVETLIPGLEEIHAKLNTLVTYNELRESSEHRKAQNQLLLLDGSVQVFKGQLATAAQEQPYDCDYNDEVEGYRDGDTFIWTCPQCGREQCDILPTAAELREED
ncbi:hypothetical protein BJD78_gp57 [Arthrobacter phage KellEzio]|uniref:Uncharacterized protein n=1 Tax=Arthrobacter phage KellEzio TaxID=1796995 RepID=A0A140G6E2_9CAUD|nr:hypothetical protein BJD78_gp57 [Arthrobacter phage KellEzio]AMM44227.1 hypothetical protein KELLEZIO_57 [Arthrobacter phage KellEzio]